MPAEDVAEAAPASRRRGAPAALAGVPRHRFEIGKIEALEIERHLLLRDRGRRSPTGAP